MLRKFLDANLAFIDKHPKLSPLKPAVSALDTFLYEAPLQTKSAPHIRDAVDLKRWMVLVVIALLPTIVMAIWNTGLQSFVYGSGDYKLMDEYLSSLSSFGDYFHFAFQKGRWIEIIKLGALSFVPIMLVSYMAGGFVEMLFATIRRHEIAEGFLVTGMLYPLVLPPTIPLWMVAIGVMVGVTLSKEFFGGTGQNIMNPALACRAFLFFTFPGRMSGDVWVGLDSGTIRESLIKMNSESGKTALDGYTQATKLAQFNISPEIKQIHVDALATNNLGDGVRNFDLIEKAFQTFSSHTENAGTLGSLTADQLKAFVTAPLSDGGLALGAGNLADATHFSALQYGLGPLNSDWLFFFGNKLGCMGETSVFAALLGALFIIVTGIGSWRTMLGVIIGAFGFASCFEWGSTLFAGDGGAFVAAQYGFPAYKHLLLGGMAFGLVYMATDPVSSPTTKLGQLLYGILIGIVAIVIRAINPAFPEGVMLAIVMANCFHPLIDSVVLKRIRRKRRVLPV